MMRSTFGIGGSGEGSTTPTTTAPSVNATTLDKILADAEIAAATIASTAALFGPGGIAVAAGAALADRLLRLILAAKQAHEAIKGVPMDAILLQLHTIDPLP